MAMRRPPRLAVGSGAWVEAERDSALQIVQSEVDEFSFSARNDFEWLNEHMSSIFSENEINVAEVFKTPGKLRGRTPMTARKVNPLDNRLPLSDVFSTGHTDGTPSKLTQLDQFQSPKRLAPPVALSPAKHASPIRAVPLQAQQAPAEPQESQSQRSQQASLTTDSGYHSGYHGSMSQEWASTVAGSRPSDNPSAARYSDMPALSSGSQSGEEDMDEMPSSPAELEMADEVELADAQDIAEQLAEREEEQEAGQDEQTEDEQEEASEDEQSEHEHELPKSTNNFLQVPAHLPPPKHAYYDDNDCAIDETAETSPIKRPPPSSPRPSSPLVIRSPRQSVHEINAGSVEQVQEQAQAAYTEEPDPMETEEEAEPEQEDDAETEVEDEDKVEEGGENMMRPTSPSPVSRPFMTPAARRDVAHDDEAHDDEDSGSASDSSSSIRPVMRKSSLNFASLPAREPMTGTKKSMGGRLSRAGQFEQTRTSHYGRHTGGKSLGNVIPNSEDDEMDVDKAPEDEVPAASPEVTANHNKAYTQRLQDQISLLGQSNANAGRSSKSIPSLAPAQIPAPREATKSSSPIRKTGLPNTPGAFPSEDDDEDDDWIASPTATKAMDVESPHSPRPVLVKSNTADVMEGISRSTTVGGNEFAGPNTPGNGPSLMRAQTASDITPGITAHPSSSEPALATGRPQTPPSQQRSGIPAPKSPFRSLTDSDMMRPTTPRTPATSATLSGSPVRAIRDSPLKQVKNKISLMFKGSKADSKTSLLLSPSKLDLCSVPSTESLVATSTGSGASIYPDLAAHILAPGTASPVRIGSPPRPARKTRASNEREKEEKRKEKEAKRMAEQMDKLEKAREKEREKVRAFTQEQEKLAEKRSGSQKTLDSAPPSPRKELVRPRTQSSARPKTRDGELNAPVLAPAAVLAPVAAPAPAPAPAAIPPSTSIPLPTATPMEIEEEEDEGEDVRMEDAPSEVPAPSRSVNGGAQAGRPREIKRPMKPSKESISKIKLAPTVIRVNTGSQHTQFHPSNGALAANLHETLAPPNVQATPQVSRMVSKVAPSTLKSKTSTQNLKSSVSGRPKALELAAKKKIEDEEAAQRKREQKLEMERKRAAMQEEQRKQEQEKRLAEQRQKQRERQEAERQKQREQEEVEARKLAQRQAMLDKAKQTRAPPPVARTHPNGPPDYSLGSSVGPGAGSQRELPRPQSRLGGGMHRQQDEHSRPVNAVLSKSAHKRTMTHDGELHGQSRNGATYQGKDAKRRRTSNEFGSDGAEPIEPLPKIKGPPVRPSGGLKKDLSSKSVFANAPPSRDLFKTSLAGQAKPGHGLDIGQMTKGPIPFASGANAHKTPARIATINAAKSAAKSAARPSPKFPNGESIELPEIQTDDDDSEDDDGKQTNIAEWADSPDLKRALMQQESVDPHQIFGPPAPLIMEEVFSKSKDRWHKFRARTSSANWSGTDRLTEDEIRRDLQARDKIRREGGWSYDMSKDFM